MLSNTNDTIIRPVPKISRNLRRKSFASNTLGPAVRRLKKPVKRAAAPVEPPSFDLEPMNPWLMCGPDTSVQELWRVREVQGTHIQFHLVFYDRYGWYCEQHGTRCGAIGEVKVALREMAASCAPKNSSGRRKARNRG